MKSQYMNIENPGELHPGNVQQFARTMESVCKALAREQGEKNSGSSMHIQKWRYLAYRRVCSGWPHHKADTYTSDAATIPLMAGHKPITNEIVTSGRPGQEIYVHTSSSPHNQSSLLIIDLIASELNKLYLTNQKEKISVTSYASGQGRELELLDDQPGQAVRRYPGCNNDSSEEVLSFPVPASFQIKHKSAARFKRKNGAQYDFVCSLGLFDNLAFNQASFLAVKMWNALKPGCRMILANCSNISENIGSINEFKGKWVPVRSQDDMAVIAENMWSNRAESSGQWKTHGCFNYLAIEKKIS